VEMGRLLGKEGDGVFAGCQFDFHYREI